MAPQNSTELSEGRPPPSEGHEGVDGETSGTVPSPASWESSPHLNYDMSKKPQHTKKTKESQHQTKSFLRRNRKLSDGNQYVSIEHEMDVDLTENEADQPQSPDVDGGWACVVFVAGFLQFLVSSGMYYSFSVFFVELLQTFGESRAKTGWIYSTNSAVHMFSGPLGGFVIVRWGPRAAIMLGGLLAGLGYFLTAFAPSLNVVFITYGFINAVGTSLNFSGWIVGLARFWNRHHALVVGLVMSGSGCGVFILGPSMERIVFQYGWRGAMLFCAGLSLNFCVFGATIFKDLRKPRVFKKKHTLMANEIITEKVIDSHKDDLSANKKESRYSNDTEVTNIQWKGNKSLETPALTSQIIVGSSWSLNESSFLENKLEKIIQWIKSLRNSNRCNTKISPQDTSDQESVRKLLYSPKFWLLEASCFLSFMSTTTLFAVFLDWTRWKGLSSSFPLALAGSGAGDLLGRLFAGILMGRGLPPLILFSGIQLLLATTTGCAALACTSVQLIASMVGFGIACGLQSVLYALMPSQLSSGDSIARVLGYLLLVTGAGALTGPPVAGLLVDMTESYDSVMILCTVAPAVAAIFNFAAHFTDRYHQQVQTAYSLPKEQNTV